MEESNNLVILSINETLLENQISETQDLPENECPLYKFNLNFYNNNLMPFLIPNEVILETEIFNCYQGEDLFIKSLNLNFLHKEFVIFLYYIENYYYFSFDLFEINFYDYRDSINKIKPKKSGTLERPSNDFDINDSNNDFIKINNEKVVFIYIAKSIYHKLVILIIYVNQLNDELYAKNLTINFDTFFPTQIKGLGYNGYLLFTATGIDKKNFYNNNELIDNYFSIFMAFGYANGTDITIDITRFLNKEAHEEKDDFIVFLYKNFKIENNIFGYIPLSVIKLVSIPKEISILQYNFTSNEGITFLRKIFSKVNFQKALTQILYQMVYLLTLIVI